MGVLFGGRRFWCRHCHGVAYAVENEDKLSRVLRRSNKLRERVKVRAGTAYPVTFKPKHMPMTKRPGKRLSGGPCCEFLEVATVANEPKPITDPLKAVMRVPFLFVGSRAAGEYAVWSFLHQYLDGARKRFQAIVKAHGEAA